MNDAAFQGMQGVRLAGDLHLAITDYFRPTALPGILRRLREQYPQLRLHVSIHKSALIEQDGATGNSDIGLSMRILEAPASRRSEAFAQHTPLRREPLACIADRFFLLHDGDALPLVVLLHF